MSSPSLLCFRPPATSVVHEAAPSSSSPAPGQASPDPARDPLSAQRTGLPRPRGRPLTPAQLMRRFGNEARGIAYRLAHALKQERGFSATAAKTAAPPESAVAKGRRAYVEDLVAIARRQLPQLSASCPLGLALATVHAECIGKRPRPPVNLASPYGDLDAIALRLRTNVQQNLQQNCQMRMPERRSSPSLWDRLRKLSDEEAGGDQRDSLIRRHDATELRTWVTEQRLAGLKTSLRPEDVRQVSTIEQRLNALHVHADALMVKALHLLNDRNALARIADVPPPKPPRRLAPLARGENAAL